MVDLNFTEYQNITNLKDFFVLANTLTNNLFWILTQFSFFVIMTLSLLGWGFENSLIVSGFISFILGLFLSYMELISWKMNLAYLGIILFVILYKIWSNE